MISIDILLLSLIDATRWKAFDQDADIRFRIKRDVSVFNRPFSQLGNIKNILHNPYTGCFMMNFYNKIRCYI
jgi:hypothetical protein